MKDRSSGRLGAGSCHHSSARGVSLDGYAESNIVVDGDHLLFRGPKAGRLCPTPAVVTDIRMSGVGSIEDPNTIPELDTYDHSANSGPPPAVVLYRRRRWTGPEWVTILS